MKNLEYHKQELHKIAEEIKKIRKDSGLPKRSSDDMILLRLLHSYKYWVTRAKTGKIFTEQNTPEKELGYSTDFLVVGYSIRQLLLCSKVQKMTDNDEVYCKKCGSRNVVKKGKSKTKFLVKQIYKCKDCGKRFVFGFGKSYPAKIVMDSITAYNLGNNLAETSKVIKKKHKVKVPEKTIYSWVKEFDKICSYYRIRDKAKKLVNPKDIVFKKVFRHLQLYKYRYHKAKIKFFVNEYFNGLKDYLFNISKNCPNELFKESIRISNIDLNINPDIIKVFKMSANRSRMRGSQDSLANSPISEHHQKLSNASERSELAHKSLIFEKENYACKLASLSLESASKNSERYDKLQEFMLVNDTCTIATEVPVYLFYNEVKRYGILNLFENSINENNNNELSLKNQSGGNGLPALASDSNALHPPDEVKQESAITGHIDFVQLKFGSVYVLDYKPEASKVSAVSQLFVYALALSVRTGIWLRNFRCAWFDEKGYYEFVPSDIILRFCKVPKHRVREFFVRNKEKRYFTSREFHEKLSKKMLNEG